MMRPVPGVPECPRLIYALHALDAAPADSGWNHAEVRDLLADSVPLLEAAVLVGLVPRPEGTRVLLTRRTAGLRQHGGQVSFPGGRVEHGDRDVVATAMRETLEETGILRRQITPLGLLDPILTVTGFRIVPVVALVDTAYLAEPDPREVAEVFEVPLRFLLEPANLSTRAFEYRGLPREVLEFSYPKQRIWGATASILFNLRQRLEDCDAR